MHEKTRHIRITHRFFGNIGRRLVGFDLNFYENVKIFFRQSDDFPHQNGNRPSKESDVPRINFICDINFLLPDLGNAAAGLRRHFAVRKPDRRPFCLAVKTLGVFSGKIVMFQILIAADIKTAQLFRFEMTRGKFEIVIPERYFSRPQLILGLASSKMTLSPSSTVGLTPKMERNLELSPGIQR